MKRNFPFGRPILLVAFLFNGVWQGGLFAQSPVRVWSSPFDVGADLLARPKKLAVDAAGNSYVTGTAHAIGDFESWVTVKYSGEGVPLWTNFYRGQPSTMVVDDQGNVFVTGDKYDSTSRTDFATVAYNTSGVPLWTNWYNGPSNSQESARAIALYTNGNVFVTGPSEDSGQSNPAFATVAYTLEGLPLWTNQFREAGFAHSPQGIAVNKDGLVVVTGTSKLITNYFDNAILTLAYSQQGVSLWTNRFQLTNNSFALVGVVALPDGGVVITGGDSTTSYHIFLVKYASDGAAVWTNSYGNSSIAYALTAAPDGTIFLAGQTKRNDTGIDLLTLAYSNTGVPLWTNSYSLSTNDLDQGKAIDIDQRGNVLVAGLSANQMYNTSATIAYSKDGVLLWTNLWKEGFPLGLVTGDEGSFILLADHQIIKYRLCAELDINYDAAGAVLTWTNSAFGWTNLQLQLQSSRAFGEVFTNVPGATSPYTNPVSEDHRFFRLIPAP